MPKPAKIVQDFVAIFGGLNTESPATLAAPAEARGGYNYECLASGGVRRIGGYERMDGRQPPSTCHWAYLPVAFTTAITAGQTITGATSLNSAYVVYVEPVDSTHVKLVVTNTHTWTVAENIKVGATVVGAMTNPTIDGGTASTELKQYYDSLVASYYRTFIQAVPGSGPVRGVCYLNDVAYAFRNSVDGLTKNLYKTTTAGWVQIPLYNYITFEEGSLTLADGDAITFTAGATAVVVRQVVVDGDNYGGSAEGRLYLTSVVGVPLVNDRVLKASVDVGKVTLGLQAFAMTAGGHLQQVVANFTGLESTRRIYGCDGVNNGFEFDGAVYIPLVTGMPTDVPTALAVHKKMLFFAFQSSVENSGLGVPYAWNAIAGASEMAFGSTVTGFLNLPGETLGICTDRSVHQLKGSSVDDFQLSLITDNVGATRYSCVSEGLNLILDTKGLVNLSATADYGDFSNTPVSLGIQSLLASKRVSLVDVTNHKVKNQLRFYFAGGYGITCTISPGKNGMLYHYFPFQYGMTPYCAVTANEIDGDGTTLVGGSDGYVYQMDRGYSFDGAEIESLYIGNYTHHKAPGVLKNYKLLQLSVSNTGYSPLSILPEFDYGGDNFPSHISATYQTVGLSGRWGEAVIDSSVMGGQAINSLSVPLFGNSSTVSLLVYSKSAYAGNHVISDVLYNYAPARLTR
jgi:hypothetical protein